MVDRIVEEFAWANVTREEAETAVKAAYAEDKVFKHDVQQEGLTALAYMKEHNCRGIVLAGRPYHIDPEINHGIPETICSAWWYSPRIPSANCSRGRSSTSPNSFPRAKPTHVPRTPPDSAM